MPQPSTEEEVISNDPGAETVHWSAALKENGASPSGFLQHHQILHPRTLFNVREHPARRAPLAIAAHDAIAEPKSFRIGSLRALATRTSIEQSRATESQ